MEALQPERSLSHNPLFQVLFNYQSEARGNGQAFRFDELQMESVQFDSRTAQFDLTLDLTDEEQRFCAVFDYATDLFDASTVERPRAASTPAACFGNGSGAIGCSRA